MNSSDYDFVIDMILLDAIFGWTDTGPDVDGWRALRDDKWFQIWDYRKAVIRLQTIYGSFPFFKVSVDKRLSPPFGEIITLDEGEIGLPHKMFYNLENQHKVVDAYKMLLRDFAINMGVVFEDAELFADEIFHYEKRIISPIVAIEKQSKSKLNQIKKLGDIIKAAPSLPIMESVQAIFPKTKITEETEVLVRNLDVLQAMSIIVSTSDKQPLNDFAIWSLARKFLPFLSREYRVSFEKYEQVLYGFKTAPPKWFICAQIVRDWVPFAVDAVQQNPGLIVTHVKRNKVHTRPISEHLKSNEFDHNDELFKLMFYHIRNELEASIENADWIDQKIRSYMNSMLASIKLQIGIPEPVLESSNYVNQYYENFLLQNLFFVEHLESLWHFEKSLLEKRLTTTEPNEKIIAELYPGHERKRNDLMYSSDLHMVIVSKNLYKPKYFDYKYPISLNFARIGNDIAELLVKTTFIYAEQLRHSPYFMNVTYNATSLIGKNVNCLDNLKYVYPNNETIANTYTKLYSKSLTFKAMQSFIDIIDSSSPISGAPITEKLTYEDIRLHDRRRQPGIREFDESQLFVLGQMQRQCSVSFAIYSRFKPYIEKNIADTDMFQLLWKHLPYLSQSLDCSVSSNKCGDNI